MTGRNHPSERRTQPVSMGGIVERLVASLGLRRNYYGWWVVSNWAEIVGEHYARKSRALRFEDGILYVAVEDASWRQMLAMDSEKVLKIIHGYPNGRVVRELRLTRGEKG